MRAITCIATHGLSTDEHAEGRALNACGIATRTGPDWLEITPGEPRGAVIDCHADHRIAMASSVLGLRTPGLQLNDPSCVAKTFPGFHTELAHVVAQWQQTAS